MTTKVKVSVPMVEKTLTVERNVEADENVTAAVIHLFSEVAVLSKTKEATQTLEQTIAEEPGKAEPQQKSAKWFYQIEQLNARFVEIYAKFVEAAEEEKEVKIGIMQALTGDLDTYWGPWTDAIQLTVKEANENGGVLGDSKYYNDCRG